MTYEEALNRKKEIGDTYPYNDKVTMDVLITPDIKSEYKEFIDDYDQESYTDSDCKNFSTNNKFRVIGYHIELEFDNIERWHDLSFG